MYPALFFFHALYKNYESLRTNKSRTNDDDILRLGLSINSVGVFRSPEITNILGVFAATNRDNAWRGARSHEQLAVFHVTKPLRHDGLVGQVHFRHFGVEQNFYAMVLL